MKTRLLLMPLLIAAVAALAACGGGSKSVPGDAVALVGSQPITKIQLDNLMTQAAAQAKASGQTPPTIGTPQYTSLRDRAIGYLVQVSELQQEATKLGVKVTNGDINAYIQSIVKLHYGGSEKKLEQAIAKSGLTLAEAKFEVMVNLLEQKLKTKVTSAAKVTTAQELAYYNKNKAGYHQNTSRSVRHILVSTKKLAEQIETKLKNGASFAALAKKYSKDTGTAAVGGKYTAIQGQDVPAFDKAAFALKTNAISQPVRSPYGWHVIQALGPIKPAHTQTFKQVQGAIQQNLVSQAQSTAWGTWLTNLQKQYKGKIAYQTGYAPATTASTAAPTTT